MREAYVNFLSFTLINCLKWPCWLRLWIVSLFEGFNHVKNTGVLIHDLFVRGVLWCSIWRSYPVNSYTRRLKLLDTEGVVMRRLRLLYTKGVTLDGVLRRVEFQNLLWLCWNEWPNSSLPSISMKNLRVLQASRSELKTLWQDNSQINRNLLLSDYFLLMFMVHCWVLNESNSFHIYIWIVLFIIMKIGK